MISGIKPAVKWRNAETLVTEAEGTGGYYSRVAGIIQICANGENGKRRRNRPTGLGDAAEELQPVVC